MTEKILTVSEAAKYLRCHPETIRRAVREGRLKAGRLGRDLRISQIELDMFWKTADGREQKREGLRSVIIPEGLLKRLEAKASTAGSTPQKVIDALVRFYLEGKLDNFLVRKPAPIKRKGVYTV
jgi:excisionase family DNA binding protein